MIKFENTVVPSAEQWQMAIMGARNPMNSWDKSDSEIYNGTFIMGYGDLMLLKKLCKAGTDHRKFMRMLPVMVDITAPLYWWKDFDTYKVGTVANSCSTMHKIHAKEFTLDDFSCEHLLDIGVYDNPVSVLGLTISCLNECRNEYIATKDKNYWWQMIQLLPSSYNQKRTVMLNYEVLSNMYKARKNHKLDEWRIGFCEWVKNLPFSDLITNEEPFTNPPEA